MWLHDRHLILLALSNSISRAHYLTQLLISLKDMNTDSPIKACWLQQPQILPIMTALCNLVVRLHIPAALILKLLNLCIDQFNLLFKIVLLFRNFIDDLMNALEHHNLFADVVIHVI